MACKVLFENFPNLEIDTVTVDETPKCGTICTEKSITAEEWRNFEVIRSNEIRDYAISKGVVEYDDRVDTKTTKKPFDGE